LINGCPHPLSPISSPRQVHPVLEWLSHCARETARFNQRPIQSHSAHFRPVAPSRHLRRIFGHQNQKHVFDNKCRCWGAWHAWGHHRTSRAERRVPPPAPWPHPPSLTPSPSPCQWPASLISLPVCCCPATALAPPGPGHPLACLQRRVLANLRPSNWHASPMRDGLKNSSLQSCLFSARHWPSGRAHRIVLPLASRPFLAALCAGPRTLLEAVGCWFRNSVNKSNVRVWEHRTGMKKAYFGEISIQQRKPIRWRKEYRQQSRLGLLVVASNWHVVKKWIY
jgi:hypothetical protein